MEGSRTRWRFCSLMSSTSSSVRLVIRRNRMRSCCRLFSGHLSEETSGFSCTLPKIHVYGFSKANNPEFDFHERINMALCETVEEVEMHRVRLVVPRKWMLCASFILPQTVAFAKTSTGQ